MGGSAGVAGSECEGAYIHTSTCTTGALGRSTPKPSIGGRLLGTEMAHLGPTLIGYAFIGVSFDVIQSQNMKARAKLTFIEQILRFNAAQIELAAAIGHLSPELFAP